MSRKFPKKKSNKKKPKFKGNCSHCSKSGHKEVVIWKWCAKKASEQVKKNDGIEVGMPRVECLLTKPSIDFLHESYTLSNPNIQISDTGATYPISFNDSGTGKHQFA